MSDVDITWHGREFFTLATKETVKAMTKAALFVEGKAKKVMGTGASKFIAGGDTKSKRGKKSFHRPSAPGFPPAVDTGVLRASISHEVNLKGLNVTAFVGSDTAKIANNPKSEAGTDVEYGFYLEVGTKRMLARPWLRPALRASEKDVLRILRSSVSGK